MKRLLLALAVLVLAGAALVLLRQPSLDRDWKDYLDRSAEVVVAPDESTVSFTDLRDWTYDASGPVDRNYTDQTYETAALIKAWFIVEPFPDMPSFGHTFLVFDFEDAPPVAFSIEALIEEGETYSAWRGLFNEYELAYTWGTERDFLTRRAVLLNHELYRYELALTPEEAREVFLAFAKGTERISAEPVFYNTLSHNCTNELAHLIEERHPGALSWDASRLLTGTADEYLFREGYIAGATFEEARDAARVAERVREIALDAGFSALLRN